jgi:hypothetical protein
MGGKELPKSLKKIIWGWPRPSSGRFFRDGMGRLFSERVNPSLIDRAAGHIDRLGGDVGGGVGGEEGGEGGDVLGGGQAAQGDGGGAAGDLGLPEGLVVAAVGAAAELLFAGLGPTEIFFQGENESVEIGDGNGGRC